MLILFTLISLLAICLCLMLYWHFKSCFEYWKKRNVPYEKPSFIFGNLMDIVFSKKSLGQYIGTLYKKFDAPYFGFFVINNPVLVIKDPQIIRKILVRDFDSFGGKIIFDDEKFDPIFANTLMGMEFGKWKRVRPKVTPIFTSSKMKMMLHLIKKCGRHLETYLDEMKGKKIDINKVVECFTINVVSSCIFGIDCNCFQHDNTAYKYHGSNLLPRSGIGSIKVYSYHFIHFLIKIFKYPFLSSESTSYFRKMFSETIQQRKTLRNKRNDLIDILLNLQETDLKEETAIFDYNLMLGQAIGFFVAGYDTSTLIISLTLYEITIHPEIQTRLRQEIHELIKNFDDITYESLDEMKYANMVISETLRKYPVVNFINRKCVQDYTVTETNLKIEKGTNIIIPTHGLHYDEKYFPNPEKFDPERFNDKINVDPYVYLPFSTGPRACVGKRFAWMSIKIGLIYVLRNFKLEKNSDTKDILTFKTSHIGHASDSIEVTCVPV